MKSNNFDIVEALWLRREKRRRSSKEIEGVPPLTFTAKAGTLSNYRIYGNTVNSESVGDLVFDGDHAGEYRVPVTGEGKNLYNELYTPGIPITNKVQYESLYVGNGVFTCSSNIPKTSEIATNLFFLSGNVSSGASSSNNGVSDGVSRTAQSIDGYVTLGYRGYDDVSPANYHVMINEGSTPLPYEPYRTPVTTPIYLPEQIHKVGDEAEYIDYADQKQHFADGTFVDVTLPALPTVSGTNTLSVGTTVQPSKVMVKGKLKE